MSKFIIFAHPRSGSTSLARVLGEIKGVKMCIEPFHPSFSIWYPMEKNYHKLINDAKSMKDALNEIFEKYTGIKVLSYQFPEKIYFSMLSNKNYKILFLTRKNLLDAALSNMIAEQTKEWHRSDNLSVYDQLKPIPITKIEEWIKCVDGTNNTHSKFLEENRPNEYFSLYYEDLFFEDIKTNANTLQRICSYLNLPLPPTESIEKYMIPANSKINRNELYKKLPNYEEIVKRFSGLG